MTILGTNDLESVNGSLANFALNGSELPSTHWARAEIAIMNRTQTFGSLGVANRVREKVGLEQLSQDATKNVERRDRMSIGVTPVLQNRQERKGVRRRGNGETILRHDDEGTYVETVCARHFGDGRGRGQPRRGPPRHGR